jgi:Pvc16 N-terminal domain
VIHDLDTSLRTLIEREVLQGGGIEISFESPNKEWVGKLTGPTIDVFLYDIREDLSRRDVAFEEVRDESGRVLERRQPPRRFRLAYLLTAWAKRPEDEHRMLSSLLACFLQSEMLPDDVLVGALADAGRPILTQIAIANDEDTAYSQVWSALGGELKPALNLAVIAPFDVSRAVPVGPPVTEQPRIAIARPDTDEVERPRRGKQPKEPTLEPALAPFDTRRGDTEDGPGRVVHVRQLPRKR